VPSSAWSSAIGLSAVPLPLDCLECVELVPLLRLGETRKTGPWLDPVPKEGSLSSDSDKPPWVAAWEGSVSIGEISESRGPIGSVVKYASDVG
jgi:hypothetical protein